MKGTQGWSLVWEDSTCQGATKPVRHSCWAYVCVLSHSVVSDSLWPHGLQPARLLCPWNSLGKNTRMGSQSLLQGMFLTKGSNPGLPHCRRIPYHLSHQGSPRQQVNKVKKNFRAGLWPGWCNQVSGSFPPWVASDLNLDSYKHTDTHEMTGSFWVGIWPFT